MHTSQNNPQAHTCLTTTTDTRATSALPHGPYGTYKYKWKTTPLQKKIHKTRARNDQVRGHRYSLGVWEPDERGGHHLSHYSNQHNQIRRRNQHQVITAKQTLQDARSTDQHHARLKRKTEECHNGCPTNCLSLYQEKAISQPDNLVIDQVL